MEGDAVEKVSTRKKVICCHNKIFSIKRIHRYSSHKAYTTSAETSISFSGRIGSRIIIGISASAPKFSAKGWPAHVSVKR